MKPHHFLLSPRLDSLLASHARCAAVAAALAIVCYWNSLQGGLVHDDIFAIRDNTDVRPETPLSNVFSNDFWGKSMSSNVSHKSYRPLTVLTFRANYALHGLDAWGYHAVNVALHALVTVVLGWLCRRLVFPEPELAFLVMCLFASHPVHTEAVTGVVGRAELLSCLCFLLSLLCYTSSLRHTPGRQALGVSGSVVLGGVAMLFKENGATVLGVCVAYDVLIHSQQLLWRSLVRRSSPVFPSLSPLLLRSTVLTGTAALLLVLRVSLLHGQLPQFSEHDNPASYSPHILTRVLTYSYLFFFNARLLVMPFTLCYDWQMGSIPLVESLTDIRNTGTLLLFATLSCLLIVSVCKTRSMHVMYAQSKVVLLSVVLMVIPFLPGSNLVLRVGFVVAERILYIPSVGYSILIVQGIKTLSITLHPSPSLQPHIPSPHPHQSPYPHLHKSPSPHPHQSPYPHLHNSPSPHPHNSPSPHPHQSPYPHLHNSPSPHHITVSRSHHTRTPKSPFTTSACRTLSNSHPHIPPITSSPTPPPSHQTPPLLFYICLLLVVVFTVKTVVRNPVWHTRESLFRSGLATVPHNAKIHYNYANYLRDTERPEEAAHHYRQALRLAPDHVSSHNNLGSLPVVGVAEAEFHFREAVRYSPSHYRALYNLGNNLLNQGRLTEAEQALTESLKINPDYYGTLMTLATMLSDSGRGEQGLKYMQRAVEVAPLDPLVRNNMAALLIRHGKVDQAITEYHSVLSLNIGNNRAEVMSNLARAYRSLGDNTNAEHWFLESLSFEEDVSTYVALGALYFNTGRHHKAKLSFSGALALDPHHTEARCSYCQCLIQLNQREQAEIEAVTALEDHPQTPCLHLILATLYAQRENTLQEAYSHSTAALETEDVRAKAEAHQIHAGILKDMGQLDRAEENYQTAISLAPTLLNAHMNLGALLHIRKNYAEARRYYEKALALDPGNKVVTENLVKLNQLDKQAAVS